MPRYSDELIEEVRSRNDIVDVISQYVRLSKKGSTYFGLCLKLICFRKINIFKGITT